MPSYQRKQHQHAPPAVGASPTDVLTRLFRGELINGIVPTLQERVRAAIAVAPYYVPRFRQIDSMECMVQADEDRPIDVPKPISQPIDPEYDELRKADERAVAIFKALEPPKPPPTLRRPDPLRVRTAGPTITPDDPGEWPHEFLARVARGEPIDGYLPTLKLQRIAAAAAAPYYAASLRSVRFQEEEEEVKEFRWTEKLIRMSERIIDGSYAADIPHHE